MTTRLDGRIAKLELHTAHLGDAFLREWGQTVTDDELRSLAAGPVRLGDLCRRLRAFQAGAMTDTELYRLIKLAIESLRGSAHEQV